MDIEFTDVIVVDLDGTLLKSDMLHESFWSALGKDWRNPIRAIRALFNGRSALKEFLLGASDVDIGLLPYDAQIVAYVKAHRQRGGRTALVTATNRVFAERIARHLKIFDEVHGSDGAINLKGSAKAEFLVDHFAGTDFAYVGDSRADLPVWDVANRIVTVNIAKSLRSKVAAFEKPVVHLTTTARSVQPYIKALRPHQWLKNALIFLPMLAAHQVDAVTLVRSMLAFVAFSVVASSVYVLNDLLDLNVDRAHPRKKRRPFASGDLSTDKGGLLALSLAAIGAILAACLGWAFLISLAVYYLLTTAYSLSLKRRIVIDIGALAGLYTMRLVAGAAATNIELSVWLVAFSIFFFFSLAAVKRQAELVDMVERGELLAKGRGYHVGDLPIISMVGLGSGYMSVLIMALYINSAEVVALYHYPTALWGICCILLYWLTRMVLITHRGSMHDDPVVFASKDNVSLFCFFAIIGFTLLGAVW